MTFSTWKQKIISKRHTASHTQVTHGMSFISSGTGIRTPTYRVRVCCATVTQYRYLEYCLSAIHFVLGCSPDVIYYNSSSSFCQYLFIIFLRFFQVFSRLDLNEKTTPKNYPMPFQYDYFVLLFERIVCKTEHIFKGMSAVDGVVVSFFFVLSVCENVEFYLRLCS